jgi:hyperosmotically inducible protein
MKLSMLIACGAIAACSSNKPAEDASNVDAPMTPPPAEEPSAPSPANVRSDLTANDSAPSSSSPSAATGRVEPSPAAPPQNPPSPAPNPAPSSTQALATPGTTAQGEPDNTRVNKRDRSAASPTPMDQGNGSSDLKITQQIRQAVMADGSLSFTAKNVKIITNNGKVTLRGPVKSDQEKQAIETSARKVAGDNVDNQLEVKK